ncbi:J domain-containing protein [Legionella jamestowniensis]|uniref:J domain-containing protein n=1 Tax=Legionella jamestowniensis TaxID=455 RepID=UPI0010419A84|nr:J domain-containing protein [Legionella jamestowniensis]
MTNFYICLDVTSDASQATIKNAYQRLLLRHQQNEDTGCEFELIQEAYDTLSDPKKRRLYDISLWGPDAAHYLRFEREGLRFALITNPQKCNYYAYISAVFRLPEEEHLIPGTNPPYIFDQKLDYVAFRMYERENYLKRFPKLNAKQKNELEIIRLNTELNIAVSTVLFGIKETKQLYDLSLGIVSNSEMAEIEKLVGGQDKLVKHVKKDPKLDITLGVLALKKANLLNPENFLKLSQANGELASISIVLEDLYQAGLLTQANFQLLLQHEKHALAYENGLSRMGRVGLVNQKFYEVLVHTNQFAGEVGTALEDLSILSIFNELTWQVIAYNIPGAGIWEPLRQMKYEATIKVASLH